MQSKCHFQGRKLIFLPTILVLPYLGVAVDVATHHHLSHHRFIVVALLFFFIVVALLSVCCCCYPLPSFFSLTVAVTHCCGGHVLFVIIIIVTIIVDINIIMIRRLRLTDYCLAFFMCWTEQSSNGDHFHDSLCRGHTICMCRILYPTKVDMISITFLILMGMPGYVLMICIIQICRMNIPQQISPDDCHRNPTKVARWQSFLCGILSSFYYIQSNLNTLRAHCSMDDMH